MNHLAYNQKNMPARPAHPPKRVTAFGNLARTIATLAAGAFILAVVISTTGCQSMTNLGTTVGVATGKISPDQAQSIRRGAGAVARAYEQLTPEQEYYIGRSVAATILGTYNPFPHEAATKYITELGRALALFSKRPETFGGWHFMILDTDEVNAFATPGGFILISRGMLRCTSNEDELAAVIAHEIAHVELEHGLRAIKKSRWTSAFTILGTEAAAQLGGRELAQLTTVFEGTITDITSTMVNSGYSRSLEREADASAVAILKLAGYNPTALINMLQNMDSRLANDKRGFYNTHPKARDRIRDIEKATPGRTPVVAHAVRSARFRNAMKGI
jgi:beta-barrel assembly-enhancing protease